MKEQLLSQYQSIRQRTEDLARNLAIEDYVIQGMTDVSPPKWHLAHTTWFFEIFILKPSSNGYQAFDDSFYYLFNSYYEGLGTPYPRAKRGLLSRPSVQKVYDYRSYVDSKMMNLINKSSNNQLNTLMNVIDLGLHHEEQHQELLLMDIKYNFSLNADFPVYQPNNKEGKMHEVGDAVFVSFDGGLSEIGFHGDGFCFDNELPRHKKYIMPFSIAKTLVTNRAYLQFIEADGYQNPSYWLSDGWQWMSDEDIRAPLYWKKQSNGQWMQFTLAGLKPLNLAEPVCHISYFEADAFARWAGFRLPLEEEWEFAVQHMAASIDGNFLESRSYHPAIAKTSDIPQQFLGDLWEWTASSYLPYPRYRPLKGILGEYNGKFMSNQMVLRGGSCVTPKRHIRRTYRNFYPADKRWAFNGIRLAKDI